MKTDEGNIYSYIIDDKDFIQIIDNQSWDTFYKNNNYNDACISSAVQNKSIWSFIEDFETRHLYENLVERVRTYKQQISIPFRCDSPTKRRFLKLTIIPLENSFIKFVSKIEKVEERENIELLNYNREHSDKLLRVCSMCKKIEIKENLWDEVEVAIKVLKLFNQKKLPMLTHGLCPFCANLYKIEMDKFIQELVKNN